MRRPDWAKAYSRKGNALHGLRLLDPAAAAYRKALELEPNNAIVAKSLLNCEQLLRDNAPTSSAAAAATSAPAAPPAPPPPAMPPQAAAVEEI